ncbi:MAG TPA: transglycosylase SLT domain-containing protein [Microbacterium sp.]|nr:transglycosylase SLT domain-containing protein [Microbacterium sp.]
MTDQNSESRTQTRRQARATQRAAMSEGRRIERAAVRAERRRNRDTVRAWTARRVAIGVLGGVAAVGIVGAMVAPVLQSQTAEASQDHEQQKTAYSAAADEAQLFAVAEHGAVMSALTNVAYEVEVPEPEPEPVVASVPDAGAAEGESTPAGPPAPIQPPAPYSGGGSPADWMAAAGIAESDWGYVDYIVSHESGWNPNATNASSGACGLVQALPCSKVPGGGYDPVANLQWANGYAVGRYGSWANAHAFWVSNSWW